MLRERTAFLAHLETHKDGLGFSTIRPYAGEARSAAKLTQVAPACLVLAIDQERGETTRTMLDALCVAKSEALKKQGANDDAAALAEALTDLLMQRYQFSEGGYHFVIDRDDNPPRTETLLANDKHSIVALRIHIETRKF